MKKLQKIFNYLLIFLFLCTPIYSGEIENEIIPNISKRMLKNGLLPSYENSPLCWTYDQALASIVFTMNKDYKKAKAVLNFFFRLMEEQIWMGREGGENTGWIGFADGYHKNGNVADPSRAAGPNAWILLAINAYTYHSKDKKFIPMAKKIAKWLIKMQSREGCIPGGWGSGNQKLHWAAFEHGVDCYAAFRDLGELTKNNEYKKYALRIRSWLWKDTYIEKEKRFCLGRADLNYATDCSSWAVLALGRSASMTLDIAIEKAKCKQYYKILGVETEGFDFGSAYGPDNFFPDKDSVWFEGTGQMVIAFALAGRNDEADYFLNELEKCLTPSTVYKGTKGLPYASNPGTPPYAGWTMPDHPPCISSTAWYIFAAKNWNPFSMENDTDKANRRIDKFASKINYKYRGLNLPFLEDGESSTTLAWMASYSPVDIINNKVTFKVDLIDKNVKQGKKAVKIEVLPVRGGGGHLTILRRFVGNYSLKKYKSLSAYVKTIKGKGNIAFILQEKNGECWITPSTTVSSKKWKKITFKLDQMKKDTDIKKGDSKFDLSSITGFKLKLIPGKTKTVFIIDDVKVKQ